MQYEPHWCMTLSDPFHQETIHARLANSCNTGHMGDWVWTALNLSDNIVPVGKGLEECFLFMTKAVGLWMSTFVKPQIRPLLKLLTFLTSITSSNHIHSYSSIVANCCFAQMHQKWNFAEYRCLGIPTVIRPILIVRQNSTFVYAFPLWSTKLHHLFI
jgi:hypothetical protein